MKNIIRMKGADLKFADEIRLKIIECATKTQFICYSDLVPNVLSDNRHMNRLCKILDHISETEWKARKLLLSSIVVQKGTTIPGIGYFDLCAKLQVSTDYKEMQDKCFDFWRDEENRANFA